MKKQLIIGLASALVTTTAALAQTTAYDANVTPAGNLAFGTGNENGGFKVVTDNGGALELGLRGKLDHQNVFPDNANGIYQVPTGAGVDPSRASWNYEFSINVNANGSAPLATLLGSYTFQLLVDHAPGTTDEFTSYDPVTLLLGDNAPFLSTTLAQNSENAAFPVVGVAGLDFNANGIYDIELIATDLAGHSTTDTITIDVGDVSGVPDATSTMPLLGAALAGLALVRRKIKA
jgi:hypothetical protein